MIYGPRAARIAAGLTVAETAKRSGLSEAYVRQIERLYDRVQSGDQIALASPNAQRAHCRAVNGDIDRYYRFPPRNAEETGRNARPSHKPVRPLTGGCTPRSAKQRGN
jgi:transcriptional regulator with XRE-family HTH domain